MLGLRSPLGCEGGVEAAVGELAPRLVRAGCDVTVYCRGRYNPLGSTVHDGVRLINTPTLYGRSTEALLHTALAAPRASLRHDLVHIHAAGPAIFSPIPRLFGRTCVVTLHGEDWERDKWGPVARAVLRAGADTALRSANAVISVSQGLATRLGTEHVPNGVGEHAPVQWDPTMFPTLRPRGYHLFLGRLVPEKGLDALIDAVAIGRLRWPVVVVGGSTYTDAWAERLRKRASDRVVFTGPQYGLEKRMLLTHARDFLLPSRIEGLPIALLEAMAAGLPTLASDIPPNHEVLGDDGWFRPVGSVTAWAEGLQLLEATGDELLRARGEAGRARVRARFSWDAVVRRTLAIYERAVAPDAAARAI